MQRFLTGMLAVCTVAAALSTTGETADADQPPHDDHPHYLFVAPTNHRPWTVRAGAIVCLRLVRSVGDAPCGVSLGLF